MKLNELSRQKKKKKGRIPDSRLNKKNYILITFSRLKQGNLCELWILNITNASAVAQREAVNYRVAFARLVSSAQYVPLLGRNTSSQRRFELCYGFAE